MPLRIEQIFFIHGLDPGVHQMCGQNQFGLDQRKNQTQHNYHGKRFKKRAHDSTDKEHRQERRDRRQHAKGRRNSHLTRAFYNIVDRVAIRPNFGIDAFANDNGIVDNNTQHNNETEQTDHVDSHWERPQRHQKECAEEGNGDTDDDPAGNFHA